MSKWNVKETKTKKCTPSRELNIAICIVVLYLGVLHCAWQQVGLFWLHYHIHCLRSLLARSLFLSPSLSRYHRALCAPPNDRLFQPAGSHTANACLLLKFNFPRISDKFVLKMCGALVGPCRSIVCFDYRCDTLCVHHYYYYALHSHTMPTECWMAHRCNVHFRLVWSWVAAGAVRKWYKSPPFNWLIVWFVAVNWLTHLCCSSFIHSESKKKQEIQNTKETKCAEKRTDWMLQGKKLKWIQLRFNYSISCPKCVQTSTRSREHCPNYDFLHIFLDIMKFLANILLSSHFHSNCCLANNSNRRTIKYTIMMIVNSNNNNMGGDQSYATNKQTIHK